MRSDYDELRPEYAPEAVAWVAERVGIGPGSTVVDLAAGTGRLSGRFLQLGVDVIAVEPAANMRAVLEERFPAVRAIVATAESMPSTTARSMPSSSATRSTTSIGTRRWRRSSRILRPGGGLARVLGLAERGGAAARSRACERSTRSSRRPAGESVIAAAHQILGRAAGPGGGVRSVRAPGVPDDPRPAGGASRGSLRDLERHRVHAGAAHVPGSWTASGSCRARLPGDAAPPGEDRRRSLRSGYGEEVGCARDRKSG